MTFVLQDVQYLRFDPGIQKEEQKVGELVFSRVLVDQSKVKVIDFFLKPRNLILQRAVVLPVGSGSYFIQGCFSV